MLASILRLLCTLTGVILAAVAILGTVVAGSIVGSMTYVFFTEPRLAEHDAVLWLRAAGALPVGLLFSWVGIRLANYGRAGDSRTRFHLQDPHQRRQQEQLVTVLNTIFGAVLVGSMAWCHTGLEPAACAVQAVGWIAGYFLLLHTIILGHELGHLAAARLAGMQPVGIRIGSGPLVWQHTTRRGFVWEWRLWPSWGYAQAVDRHEQPAAWRFFVFIAGGPVAGGLCVGLALYGIFRLGMHGDSPLTWMRARGIYPPLAAWPLYYLLAMGVFSLVPHQGFREGILYYSDGWWLRRVFSFPAATYHEFAFAASSAHMNRLRGMNCDAHAQAEEDFLLARFPERRALLRLTKAHWHRQRRGIPLEEEELQRALEESSTLDPEVRALAFAQYAANLAALGDLEAARAFGAATLARVPEAERVLQLDALACIPIYHRGTSALLPDADRWCHEALEWSPDEITLRGTLGALRFEQGQVEEAVAILREVLATTQSDMDRGIASFYLALAAGRYGQRREMVSMRAQALRWCKVPTLLGRIHTELNPG